MIWILFWQYWEKLGNFLFHHLVTLNGFKGKQNGGGKYLCR